MPGLSGSHRGLCLDSNRQGSGSYKDKRCPGTPVPGTSIVERRISITVLDDGESGSSCHYHWPHGRKLLSVAREVLRASCYPEAWARLGKPCRAEAQGPAATWQAFPALGSCVSWRGSHNALQALWAREGGSNQVTCSRDTAALGKATN